MNSNDIAISSTNIADPTPSVANGINPFFPFPSGQMHIYDIVIGIGFAFLAPIIYSRIQKEMKKRRVKKFWRIFLGELDRIKKGAAISPGAVLLVVSKMRRIELLVSDILNEEDFHNYMDRIDYIEQAVKDLSGDIKYKIERFEKWLQDLISSN